MALPTFPSLTVRVLLSRFVNSDFWLPTSALLLDSQLIEQKCVGVGKLLDALIQRGSDPVPS
jgi:hypothetical protein